MKTMENDGKRRKTTENDGKRRKTMENDGKRWKHDGKKLKNIATHLPNRNTRNKLKGIKPPASGMMPSKKSKHVMATMAASKIFH